MRNRCSREQDVLWTAGRMPAVQPSQLVAVILAALLTAGEVAAAVVVPQGYTSSETDLTIPIWFGGFDYLPDGRFIYSDSENVFILHEDGTRITAALFETGGLFGSFVKVAPDGHTVYVGESSVGTISRFDLHAGGVPPIGPGTPLVVAEVPLHYDMEFDPQGRAFVSAATPDTWQPNRLLLLDPESGETDLIAILQGNSGPLVFDEVGNLLYCTSTSYPPEAVESVLFFPPDKVDEAVGEGHLTESDAQVLVSGIYGFSDMAFDDDGDLFGVTSSGEITEISVAGWEVTTRKFASVSPDALGATVVRFLPGTSAFEPYYAGGGTLTFLESDFGSLYRLVHVTPFSEFGVISVESSPEGMNVAFTTQAGKHYQLYWSDDPASGWHPLGDVMAGQGGPVSVVDMGSIFTGRLSPTSPFVTKRFYKVQCLE